jgi:protein-disulfide isomerase
VLATEPEVIERYVRSGQLRLVFRAVLNHGERSVRTSEAAACAGVQGKFWQMHGMLFERQGSVWGTASDGEKLVTLMLTYAGEIAGLDQAAFKQCMTERTTLAMLRAVDAEQRTRGITFQPIFEIGEQRITGAQPIDSMARVIDAALK